MPDWLLGRDEMIEACAARDVGAIFRLAKRYTGCYNSRLARLCGLTPSRVGEYISGRSRAQQQQVIERIADGLCIPGHMLGLSPRPWEANGLARAPESGGTTAEGRTAPPGSVAAPPRTVAAPTEDFEEPNNELVELSTEVVLDIADDGTSRLMYRHVLLNLGQAPVSRLVRQVWFERTTGSIGLVTISSPATRPGSQHTLSLRRIHETESFLKFACLISPPLATQEPLVIQYLCTGGLFTDELYWRQDVVRPTKHLRVSVRQGGVRELKSAVAIEEFADGREVSSAAGLAWTHRQDGTVFLTCTRADLSAPQALTLRWDATRRDAGDSADDSEHR
ncbi:hypothetical protein OG216_46335 (plasmid) [Streptomycetaceae bacterium NBC_01309]